jgi:hypothetical protein
LSGKSWVAHKAIAAKWDVELESSLLFRISSAVEQWTVNPLVASSNLASGVYDLQALKTKILGAFLFSGHNFPHFFPTSSQHITTTQNRQSFQKMSIKSDFLMSQCEKIGESYTYFFHSHM